jgi:hypothetical protein
MAVCGYNVKYHEMRCDAFTAVTMNSVVCLLGNDSSFDDENISY